MFVVEGINRLAKANKYALPHELCFLHASCWFLGLHFNPEEGGSVKNQDIDGQLVVLNRIYLCFIGFRCKYSHYAISNDRMNN
jgi:hypothetical protein